MLQVGHKAAPKSLEVSIALTIFYTLLYSLFSIGRLKYRSFLLKVAFFRSLFSTRFFFHSLLDIRTLFSSLSFIGSLPNVIDKKYHTEKSPATGLHKIPWWNHRCAFLAVEQFMLSLYSWKPFCLGLIAQVRYKSTATTIVWVSKKFETFGYTQSNLWARSQVQIRALDISRWLEFGSLFGNYLVRDEVCWCVRSLTNVEGMLNCCCS